MHKRCEHTDGAWHDCRYVDQRNALIKAAADEANNEHGKVRDGMAEERTDAWNRTFHEAMKRLATMAGLGGGAR
jgi:hypothetical protein